MKVKLSIPKPANKDWKVKGKTIEEVFKNLQKHKWWGRYRAHPSYSYKPAKGKVTEFTLKAKPEIIMPSWTYYSKATKAQKAQPAKRKGGGPDLAADTATSPSDRGDP